jgi:hypothetical protein
MKASPPLAWLVFVVVLIIEVLLSLSPLIPALSSIVKSTLHESDPVETQITLTGIHAVLVTLFLGAAYASIQGYLARLRQEIEISLNEKPLITTLRDDEFHGDFLLACGRARSHVLITNLTPAPIYFNSSRDRLRYLDDLVKRIQKKPEVQFRRLMRNTPENMALAQKLIQKLEGCPNAYLALIHDSATEANPLALSVQIVDDEDCWLVALSSHDRQTNYRDIHVRDRTFAGAIYKYHERLWQKALVVLDRGVITENWRSIQLSKEGQG